MCHGTICSGMIKIEVSLRFPMGIWSWIGDFTIIVWTYLVFRSKGERKLFHTSIPPIHPTYLLIGLSPLHLKWPWVHYFGDFEAHSDVTSSKKISSRMHTIFGAFTLDEWEVHSYTIIPFVPIQAQRHGHNTHYNYLLSHLWCFPVVQRIKFQHSLCKRQEKVSN